jgi:hypothetical protein
MHYPTLDQVNAADRAQLCAWWRFLDSPGTEAIGRDDFETVMQEQKAIMDRIAERFREAGGFSPEISKSIGWGS